MVRNHDAGAQYTMGGSTPFAVVAPGPAKGKAPRDCGHGHGGQHRDRDHEVDHHRHHHHHHLLPTVAASLLLLGKRARACGAQCYE